MESLQIVIGSKRVVSARRLSKRFKACSMHWMTLWLHAALLDCTIDMGYSDKV
jgi:hypothetical protein